MWRVRLERRAEKDLLRLGTADQRRVRAFIDERLGAAVNPRNLGAPLTGPFSGQWKYRVGDIRIIAEIWDDELLIVVVQVGNRREVYR